MSDGALPLVYSTHPLHPDAMRLLEGKCRFAVASALEGATLDRESRDFGAEIVIVRAPLPESLFDNAPALRAAIRHGAGLDMIPVEAATKAGVLVANVPAVNARSVAEHVFFAAMALLRRFRMVDRDLRQQGWLAGRDHAIRTNELAGRTVAIVGYGAVGREVARIGRAGFDLDVVVVSRSPIAEEAGIRRVGLAQALECADILVLCCPLTPETRGLIGPAELARLKPQSILVNVARGPVVDEAALIEALDQRRIAGAALDVFDTQPLPQDHPFFGFETVILTPHMAGITEESMARMGAGAAREALRVIAGELPVNLRNPEVVDRYRARFSA